MPKAPQIRSEPLLEPKTVQLQPAKVSDALYSLCFSAVGQEEGSLLSSYK